MSTRDFCTIREVGPSDAGVLSTLSTELGYPVPVEVMRERIARRAKDPAVFVADAGKVLGWIDVGLVFHLQSGLRAEIGGLVVSSASRSLGIGRQLLQRAEQWAREKGMTKVLLRSNSKRSDAHRFYLREQYTQVKTSAVIEKDL